MSNRPLSLVWGIYLGGVVFVVGTVMAYVRYTRPDPDIDLGHSPPVFMPFKMPNSYDSHMVKGLDAGVFPLESDAGAPLPKCETDDCKVDRWLSLSLKEQSEIQRALPIDDKRPETEENWRIILLAREREKAERLRKADEANAKMKKIMEGE